MFYKVSADSVRLFDDHPPEGKEIPGFANLVFKGQEVTEISPSPDETWVKVWYKTEGANIIEGWIERANLEEAGTPERDKIVLWAFLKSCVRAEFAVNQLKDTKPYFVNADFLIALALYHGPNDTITNLGHKDPADLDSAVGPFQITAARWTELRQKSAAIEAASDEEKTLKQNFSEYGDFDRDLIVPQIYGTAFLTREDTRAISQGLTPATGANTSQNTDQYIPTYTDLFIAALSDIKVAIAARKLMQEGKGDKAIDELLGEVEKDRRAELEQALKDHRHIFTNTKRDAEAPGVEKGARTLAQVYEKVEAKLDDLFKQAFKLMEEHIPEDLPDPSGEPTWMDVAEAEQKDPWKNGGVKETEQKAKVLEYFKSTDLDPGGKLLHWCGAFVAHCVNKGTGSNAPIAGAALAANWKNWGAASVPIGTKKVPPGAIIVLSPPPGSNTSGHVGFASRNPSGAQGKITLLGGNQSDSAKDSDFPRSRVVAIRWPTANAPEELVADDNVPPGEGLAWGRSLDPAKLRSDPGEFKAKVRTIANKIQCNPHHLMAVMAFETGRTFSPSVRNPRGSATGLIQFISSTANALGTTTTKLAAMTAVEQLDVVEAYFKMQARGRRFERLSDLYMAVLFPVAIPKPDGAALFKRGTRNYSANAGLDINNDGIVTKGEAAAKVRQQLERGLRPENRG